jgi:hypothetical protein
MPYFAASRSMASTKLRPSIFWMKAIASPPSPQPKQWKVPRAGLAWNDGVFSSWNGHRPFMVPPERRSVTYCSTTSSMRARSRTSWMSSSLIRPATGRS